MSTQKIRRWRIEPDMEMDTAQGPVAFCSDDAIGRALADGVAICQRMGGKLLLDPARTPTDMQGEAVTAYAIVTWLPYMAATEGNEERVELAEMPAPIEDEDLVPVPLEEEEDLSSIPEALR